MPGSSVVATRGGRVKGSARLIDGDMIAQS